MEYYTLKLLGLERKLPLISISPKLKIASFNLLGDGELVEIIAQEFVRRLEGLEFNHLVGPEVKVVPLLQSLATKIGKPRYVILRKNIMGYMMAPVCGKTKPNLVLNGPDAELLKGKRVVVIDDVVSTGSTVRTLTNMVTEAGAKVVGTFAVLKQGEDPLNEDVKNLSFLATLPLFKS